MTKEEFLDRIKEDEEYSPGWQAIDESVYGKTDFIQLVGITESEIQAIIEDKNNIPKLIELMKADGNKDLVTDMRRTKSYL